MTQEPANELELEPEAEGRRLKLPKFGKLDKLRLPDLPDMPDLPEIGELAAHLSRLFPPPNPYLIEPWEVSLAALVDRVPHVPDIAVKALGMLDGFGAVHIGPQEVGFDGEEIEWDKVVCLRTRRVSDLISGAVLEAEVDRLRKYLPPVPGRKWAVTKAVDMLVVLSMVALEDQLAVVTGIVDGARSLDGATEQVTRDGRVVSEIVYKGWVRKEKELQAGLLASAVLGQVRGADHCLREMAAARRIPVVPAEDGNDLEDATERAAAIRRRIEELRARIPFLRRDPEPDGPAEIGDNPVNNPSGGVVGHPIGSAGGVGAWNGAHLVANRVGNRVDNVVAKPVANPAYNICGNRVANPVANPGPPRSKEPT
jgi:hypothetical protein